MNLYVLDEHGEPKLEPDPYRWALWFHGNVDRRIVKRDECHGVVVVTMFLAFDSVAIEGLPPILWHTIAFFPGTENVAVNGSDSREQALASHAQALETLEARWKLSKTMQN